MKAFVTGVAGFIGSPKMNFLTGQHAEPFGAHTVGLRSEHLAVVSEGGHWTGQVIHTEILGSDTYVYIDLGLEEPLVVRESGVAVRKSGETLSVSPAGDNIHRFDEKGRAV